MTAPRRLCHNPAIKSKSLTYIPAVDGMRAVSVLLVFFGHVFFNSGFTGGLGVDVFFVISGYLITSILLKEQAGTGRIRLPLFYLRRALRLYPALIAVVVAVTATWWLFDTTLVKQVGRAIVALTYTSNIVSTVTDLQMGPLLHTWSLAMEEQFYLVWPLILIVMARGRLSHRTATIVVSLLAAASLIGWILQGGEQLYPYNPMTNAGTLLVGCVLALMLRDKPAQSTAAAYGGVAVMAIVITLGTVAVLSTSYTHVLVTLATAPIIAHCVYGSSLLTRALSVRWMVHLGSISYAFYLWHFPILLALDWNTGLPGWVNSMIGLILTVAIAEFSMRFIESPALRLKDRIGPLRSDGMAREPKNVPEPGD